MTHSDILRNFDRLWQAIEQIGRSRQSGGYRRYAWPPEDFLLREWFASEADVRGFDLVVDRAGNQWAWCGDPDAPAAAGKPGVVLGTHLDSVPDGEAFDGPLGVVSAFIALDELRLSGRGPERPLGIVNFSDDEGDRFGATCAGSRPLTGSLPADNARSLADTDGVSMAEAVQRFGQYPHIIGHGRDDQALRRIGTFSELHVEQGRTLAKLERPVGVGSSIWPHGRWRLELRGEAYHAGTTRLTDRRDPMLGLAAAIATARSSADTHGCVATIGKVRIEPNAVNAIPSTATAWSDARAAGPKAVAAVVADVAQSAGTPAHEESSTVATELDPILRKHLTDLLEMAPALSSDAGHDAGVLARAGIRSAMLFVRNPSGISHSPAEHADHDDCLAGVAALAKAARAVLQDAL